MKGLLKASLTTALSTCLSLGAAGAAIADDTEIFVGEYLDAGQPNVLFIMDTSGSMGGIVQSNLSYDPDKVYTGACPADRIYFSDDGSPPDCDDDDWFDAASLVCDAALDPLAAAGSFRDRSARWEANSRPSKSAWKDLKKAHEDELVECRSDYGVHGDGSNAVLLYPADKLSGPWSANPSDAEAIDWDDFDFQTLFSANYLNYVSNPGNQRQTRLDVVKEVSRDVLQTTNGINVGLMRFSRNGEGGMVLADLAPIGLARSNMITLIDGLDASGSTPLAETLYEAGQYFAGRAVDYGLNSTPQASVAASRNGNTYLSPIEEQCQKNFIVLLTDGEPTSDTSANDRIKNLPGFNSATGQNSCSGNCLDEMAAYLNKHDLRSTLADDQSVDTYTIGFHTNQALLSATADRGNGQYFTADDTAGLARAFANIIEDILSKDVTFSAPSIAVNNFNRLTHRDDLFYSLFRPLGTPHWEGNLKRYRLGRHDGEMQILDAQDLPAIDAATDNFLPTARSYWTLGNSPDGADVVAGGLRSRLGADRRIYTITGMNTLLSAPENRVHESNTSLSAALLEVDAADREAVIRWARGVDENDDPRRILGDALHSVPLLLSYGGSVANPDLTLYYVTNDGYLHAVDPLAGAAADLEVFSFIPKELLPQLAVVSDPTANTPVKAYGLDGPMSYWIKNDDGDGAVDAGTERAFLYFGMRRGGSSYYAVDVTDRSAPRLAWMIRGGEGQFAELGQTWSEATPARVQLAGQTRHVLFFGGGYDVNQDATGASSPDARGRSVFMVDAETGERLWWAANASDHGNADLPLALMTNSIPSSLRVIDMNSDGYADRLYVGDTAAQVWRFDLDNYGNTGADDFASGGVIAALGGGGRANNRRFYYPPSVSLVSDEYYGSFIAVAIGSGHRANPLGTGVADRFYMVRDPNVLAPAHDGSGNPEYRVVLESDLLDVTSTLAPSLDDLNAADGWLIEMNSGEKVLAPALTADGKVYFTTYRPGSAGALSCTPSGAIGSARLYAVAIGSGGPRLAPDQDPLDPDFDPDNPGGGEGDPDCMHRCEDTAGPIPPEPVLVLSEPDPDAEEGDPCDGLSQASLVVGTTIHNPNICTAPVPTYWVNDGPE